MKKLKVLILAAISALFTSCITLGNVDYSVPFTETAAAVNAKSAKIINSQSYLISFPASDSEWNMHKVIILDEKYLKLDKKVYAYKFDSLMRYQHGYTNSSGTFVSLEKEGGVVGFTGYATSVDNPETTIRFIFARQLASPRYYTSTFDARQKDKGVYYTGLPRYSNVMIDGQLQRATYYDYFPLVFRRDDDDRNNMRKSLYIVINQL